MAACLIIVRILAVDPAPTRQVYAVWRSVNQHGAALQAAVLALVESFEGASRRFRPASRRAGRPAGRCGQ